MITKLKNLLPLIPLFAISLFPLPALSQLSISPLVIERKAESGQARGVIDVYNDSPQPYRARVSLAPFTYNREGLQVLESSPNDLTPYLTFSPRELVIQPGQKRSIRFNARLLPSLPKGEYRAMFSIEELKQSDSTQENQVGIAVNIVSTIYVRNGDLSPLLSVENAFFDSKTKEIRILVKNNGSATTRARTDWSLTQNGEIVNSGKLEETTIIAEGDRYIRIPTQGKTITPGTYQLSGQLNWDFPKKGGKLPFNLTFTVSQQDITSDQ
jgi:P pilus assembly chaperone PapD